MPPVPGQGFQPLANRHQPMTRTESGDGSPTRRPTPAKLRSGPSRSRDRPRRPSMNIRQNLSGRKGLTTAGNRYGAGRCRIDRERTEPPMLPTKRILRADNGAGVQPGEVRCIGDGVAHHPFTPAGPSRIDRPGDLRAQVGRAVRSLTCGRGSPGLVNLADEDSMRTPGDPTVRCTSGRHAP